MKLMLTRLNEREEFNKKVSKIGLAFESFLSKSIEKNPETNLSEIDYYYETYKDYYKKFLEEYPKEKLKDLTIDQYCVGLGEKNSFCYRLERPLTRLGSIRGGTSLKFGIFKNRLGGYTYSLKYRDQDEAFSKIINEVHKIANRYSIQVLNESNVVNTVPELARNKIYFLYHPKSSYPIYNSKHLKIFVDYLYGQHPGTSNYVDLIKKLEEFYTNNLENIFQEFQQVINETKENPDDMIDPVFINILERVLFVQFLYKDINELIIKEGTTVDLPPIELDDIFIQEVDSIQNSSTQKEEQNELDDSISNIIDGLRNEISYTKVIIEDSKKEFKDQIKETINDFRIETSKKIEDSIKDSNKSSLEFIGIFAAIISLLVVDINFLKQYEGNGFVLVGLLLGINTVPFLFFFFVKYLFGNSNTNENINKDKFIGIRLIQLILSIILITIGIIIFPSQKDPSSNFKNNSKYNSGYIIENQNYNNPTYSGSLNIYFTGFEKGVNKSTNTNIKYNSSKVNTSSNILINQYDSNLYKSKTCN